MTELFDCARLWAQLPPAALYIIAGIGQADALDADDMRRSRFYDIADGIAIDALSQRLDEAGLLAGDASLPLPDLRPFGVQQCAACGCIEEVACARGRAWAAPDRCSACPDGREHPAFPA